MSTTQFNGVSVITKANVYFDGKCVSHNIVLADGSKKSLGVILPSTLKFNTGAPELMELVEGACRVKLAGSEAWVAYAGGQSFSVGANTSFEIEVTQAVHYVCHFG
jgi:purine/pyrimidine-nucleoside phosphorylase